MTCGGVSIKGEICQFQGTLVGYIEPGHGAKVKMRELHNDKDMVEMYVLYKRCAALALW